MLGVGTNTALCPSTSWRESRAYLPTLGGYCVEMLFAHNRKSCACCKRPLRIQHYLGSKKRMVVDVTNVAMVQASLRASPSISSAGSTSCDSRAPYKMVLLVRKRFTEDAVWTASRIAPAHTLTRISPSPGLSTCPSSCPLSFDEPPIAPPAPPPSPSTSPPFEAPFRSSPSHWP